MKTTIDGAGRLVVPKTLRDRLSIGAGVVVDVIERNGVIEIHPMPVDVELVQAQGGPIARSVDRLPPLTEEVVRDTLERVRR